MRAHPFLVVAQLPQSQLAPEIGIATCRKLAVVCAEATMPVAVDATGGDGTSRIRRDAVQL